MAAERTEWSLTMSIELVVLRTKTLPYKLVILLGVALIASIARAVAGTATIRAADYGDRWPFTVSEGVIECTLFQENLHILTFASGGKTYGLNGTARNLAREKGYAEIAAIWKDDPKNTGTKINIGPVIDKALSLCE
jgi:hypothetical protein